MLGATERRREELILFSILSFLLRAPLSITQISLIQVLCEDKNVSQRTKQTKHIRHTSFNVYVFSDLEDVTGYRFKKKDLRRILEVVV